MSDNKHEVTQTENGRVRGRKKTWVKNHCRKFWWLHLIVFLCITTMVICLVIFIGVQNIAQWKINQANLEIQGVNIIQTKANSFLMQINSTITTDGTVKANINPFLGNLTLTDVDGAKPFVQLQFPATNADKFQTVNVSQEVEITDLDAFEQFNKVFYQNETLRVSIDGKTQVIPRSMTKEYPVNFHKTVTFKGLNLLNGTTLENPKVSLGGPAGVPNLNATVVLTNPSYYTLDLGNVTFNQYVSGQLAGNLTIFDLFLSPGENKFPVEAILDQAIVLTAASQKPTCSTGQLEVKQLGTKVENNGQEIPWLEAALGSANATVSVDINSILRTVIPNYTAKCS